MWICWTGEIIACLVQSRRVASKLILFWWQNWRQYLSKIKAKQYIYVYIPLAFQSVLLLYLFAIFSFVISSQRLGVRRHVERWGYPFGFYVIFQKRVRVFHRGFKHENTDESARRHFVTSWSNCSLQAPVVERSDSTIHTPYSKWRQINYSFVSMLISPLCLIFTSKFLCSIHADEELRAN